MLHVVYNFQVLDAMMHIMAVMRIVVLCNREVHHYLLVNVRMMAQQSCSSVCTDVASHASAGQQSGLVAECTLNAGLEDALLDETGSSDDEEDRQTETSDSESDVSIDDIITDLGGGLSLMERYPVLLNDAPPGSSNSQGMCPTLHGCRLPVHMVAATCKRELLAHSPVHTWRCTGCAWCAHTKYAHHARTRYAHWLNSKLLQPM